jgi:hypothetical protein
LSAENQISRDLSVAVSEKFVPLGTLNTAVLFLVFNRPDVTAQVFDAIRKARPSRLYVAADGPRAEREGEATRCAEVRRIATAVDWPCEVRTLFREKNLGCKRAVSGAISWFFDNEEQGIILEDDCLPSQSFFWYCQQLLIDYSNDERIGSIAGSLRRHPNLDVNGQLAKSKYFNMWGWATWRRVWVDYTPEYFECDVSFEKYKNIFGRLSVGRYWRYIFERMRRNEIDTWDYQFMFLSFEKKYYTVYPSVNLVENIGFGVDATHCHNSLDASAFVGAVEYCFNCLAGDFDDLPIIDGIIEREYMRKIYLMIFLGRVGRGLLRFFNWTVSRVKYIDAVKM